MKFLCDVHISYKLTKFIESAGHEAIHINTILDKWFTKDNDIARYADEHDFIIITKDVDFRDSFFIKKSPKKLMKINLGNISNSELQTIFGNALEKMKELDTDSPFLLEIDRDYFNYHTI